MPSDSALGQYVVEFFERSLPHHLGPVRPSGLFEVDERLGMVRMSANVDIAEAHCNGVTESECIRWIGHGTR